MTNPDVCLKCSHLEHCEENCEAYMTLARLSINIGDFNLSLQDGSAEQTAEEYLDTLGMDITDLVTI